MDGADSFARHKALARTRTEPTFYGRRRVAQAHTKHMDCPLCVTSPHTHRLKHDRRSPPWVTLHAITGGLVIPRLTANTPLASEAKRQASANQQLHSRLFAAGALAQARISPNLIKNLPARAARQNFVKICLFATNLPKTESAVGHQSLVAAVAAVSGWC